MYNEQIKEILMKTYDVCAYTLDCGSSAVWGKKLYYYTLDKDPGSQRTVIGLPYL